MNPDILAFWRSQGIQHVIPAGSEFPEGWDVRDHLRLLLAGRKVTEIGCGYGRLCEAFAPADYLGLDINPVAIEEAQKLHPRHVFRVMRDGADFSEMDATLIYTVLLHVDDNDISGFLGNVCAHTRTLVVAEIMDRKWRRPGNPPVFNRDPGDYEAMLGECGFAVRDTIALPYMHYPDTDITFMVCARRA